MRLAWVTDIHLNFLSSRKRRNFLRSLSSEQADAVLVGGDIGEADTIERYLRDLVAETKRPMYVVLGNHDFYRGSITAVRSAVTALCQDVPGLTYLPQAGVVELTETTALVGHDGWGDGRYGNYASSTVELNDHVLIEELTGLSRAALREALEQLGDAAAAYLREVLPCALALYRQVILLTHVPPFREACWHEGRLSDDDWLPFFSCQAVGDVLLEVMRARPECRVTVLCGHTHSAGTAQILPNLLVLTGHAEYGAPEVQRVLEVV